METLSWVPQVGCLILLYLCVYVCVYVCESRILCRENGVSFSLSHFFLVLDM